MTVLKTNQLLPNVFKWLNMCLIYQMAVNNEKLYCLNLRLKMIRQKSI